MRERLYVTQLVSPRGLVVSCLVATCVMLLILSWYSPSCPRLPIFISIRVWTEWGWNVDMDRSWLRNPPQRFAVGQGAGRVGASWRADSAAGLATLPRLARYGRSLSRASCWCATTHFSSYELLLVTRVRAATSTSWEMQLKSSRREKIFSLFFPLQVQPHRAGAEANFLSGC